MELCDIELASKKAVALRATRKAIWEILDTFDLPLYSKEDYKEYKFISTSPKADAMRLARALQRESPYVTVHSYVFGKEQIISIDNFKVAYIYYCDLDIDKVKMFNGTKDMYSPVKFLDMKEGGIIRRKKKTKKKIVDIDEYLSKCKIKFARSGKYISSVDIWTMAKEIKKKYDKIKFGEVRYEISKIFLFDDFRLKRITFVNSSGPFLYLFNNMEYEALPLINGDLHPVVVYRYKMYNMLLGSEVPKFPEISIPDEYVGKFVNEKIDKFKLGGFMIRLPLSHAD